MRQALVRDPQLANEGLLIACFRDSYGTGQAPPRPHEPDGAPTAARGIPGEQAAAAFYLEHRQGPRSRSISDLTPVIGRSLSPIDIEGTVQEIERAIALALPREWRAATVVATAWALGADRLRQGTFLERAGMSRRLPEGLSRRTLERRKTQLREQFIVAGLVDLATARAVQAVEFGEGDRAMQASRGDRIDGWKGIGDVFGISERQAQRWHAERGLPVYQSGPGGKVWAWAQELRSWEQACMVAGTANVAPCRDLS